MMSMPDLGERGAGRWQGCVEKRDVFRSQRSNNFPNHLLLKFFAATPCWSKFLIRRMKQFGRKPLQFIFMWQSRRHLRWWRGVNKIGAAWHFYHAGWRRWWLSLPITIRQRRSGLICIRMQRVGLTATLAAKPNG